MDTTIENLKRLLFSGDSTMIELGFQLIKSQNLSNHPYIQELMNGLSLLIQVEYNMYSFEQLLEHLATEEIYLGCMYWEANGIDVESVLVGIAVLLKEVSSLTIEHHRKIPFIDTLYQFTRLKKLTLNIGELKTFPKNIGMLSNLEELKFNQSWIEVVPKEIGELKQLKSLTIYSFYFVQLPYAIRNIPNLYIHLEKYLKIKDSYSYNETPAFFYYGEDKKLEFKYDYEPINELLDVFKYSEIVSIAYSKMDVLPTNLQKMPNLIELAFQELNWLFKLPDWFYKLTTLRVLDFTKCGIIELKSDVKQLINLTDIYIAQNNQPWLVARVAKAKEELESWLLDVIIKAECF